MADSMLNDYFFTELDECLQKPCLNGGECIDIENGFVCECVAPYHGTVCSYGKSLICV